MVKTENHSEKNNGKINLFGKTQDALKNLMQDMGEPAFRGKQLFEWLYQKRVRNISDCTNLSKALREKLSVRCTIDWGKIIEEQADPDDGTKKFLIEWSDGECIETVLMAYDYGYSLCVSSQVGCAMGCAFCASTRGGLVRNLTAGEIAAQIALIEAREGIHIGHVVVMGIGEPLANFDNIMGFLNIANKGFDIGMRRITVSTCGLVPMIDKLAEQKLEINLAISLHSPFQDVRETIMPVAKTYDIDELLAACRRYFKVTGRRITFEYALMAGINDRPEDVAELTRLFHGENIHINLIRLNPISESGIAGSTQVTAFANQLKKNGINCTIRRRIGKGIDAACGQLRHKNQTESRI